MNTQDVINSLYQHEEHRRREHNAAYDRMLHNEELQAIINELTEEE